MLGVRDIFRIGIGPSSSHTVGPMKAAASFARSLHSLPVARIRCDLLGSLAWTGAGHATDAAVVLGLSGHQPDTILPDEIPATLAGVRSSRRLMVAGTMIDFDPAADIAFDRDAAAPVHPNTMRLVASDDAGQVLLEERWCSIGGGFISKEDEVGFAVRQDERDLPFPFASADDLLALCSSHGMTIAEIMLANERAGDSPGMPEAYLDMIIEAMLGCIDRGVAAEGLLPGRLQVPRRAAGLKRKLDADRFRNQCSPHAVMDHVSLFAIAVNEENAGGGRVVTAPTNGAAGVLPAVLRYYRDFWPDADRAGMHTLMLTAAAVGALIKTNASISGAEVGCQGEVGTASSMAAAGLAAALGGDPAQVENAAEIAMEHHLGMTCDPIAGLVQVPCIERNAFGAVKAITAASLALRGDGRHLVSLDQVIETMFRTGTDMHAKYKETSRGGLAVAFPEC